MDTALGLLLLVFLCEEIMRGLIPHTPRSPIEYVGYIYIYIHIIEGK